jgi:fermentation-respiration switch protein FrsA (DUF1100 family)
MFLRIAFSVARIVIASYAGLCLYMFLFQSRYVYYPSATVHANPGDIGLEYQDLRLKVKGGEIQAWAVPPSSARSTKWVLYCHGNAGNIGHRLDMIQLFRELGFGVLIFDYRGYGESTGKPTESNTYADAMAAWIWLTQERGVPTDNVVVFGRSLGGAVAAWLAVETSPGALVLDSAFTSIPDMGKRLYPYLPVRLFARIRYPTEKYVAQVACPVLVLHSPTDEIVPFEFGQRLFEAAPEPKTFVEINGGHNDARGSEGWDYTSRLVKGLEKIGW